jgi:hypothetical protein
VKVEQESWTIKHLVLSKDKIELTPVWQRGPAWKLPRQVLLLDSILRGMDIPKVYLRKLTHGIFTHDAVDGQQRLRAIWMFHDGQITLSHPDSLPPIDDEVIADKKFSQLSQKLRDRFDEFIVSIGEITSSKSDEIRNLFARLQMGVSLNPAELRNAMDGPLRYSIDSTARLHSFFKTCRISSERFKHLDYAAHSYAIAAYHGTKDMKAPDLRDMISEFSSDRGNEVLELSAKVDEALIVLADINNRLEYSITQKWIFVDLSWLIMQYQADGRNIDVGKLAHRFKNFENLRRAYNAESGKLLRPGDHPNVSDALSQHLYDYIGAFKVQGGLRGNIVIRNNALRAFCR